VSCQISTLVCITGMQELTQRVCLHVKFHLYNFITAKPGHIFKFHIPRWHRLTVKIQCWTQMHNYKPFPIQQN